MENLLKRKGLIMGGSLKESIRGPLGPRPRVQGPSTFNAREAQQNTQCPAWRASARGFHPDTPTRIGSRVWYPKPAVGTPRNRPAEAQSGWRACPKRSIGYVSETHVASLKVMTDWGHT